MIDINYYPVEQARRSNFRHRPIGIGVQGFADLLMRLRLPFESKGAIQLNRCDSSILSPPAAFFCFGSLSPFRFCFSVSVRVFISLSESGFFTMAVLFSPPDTFTLSAAQRDLRDDLLRGGVDVVRAGPGAGAL